MITRASTPGRTRRAPRFSPMSHDPRWNEREQQPIMPPQRPGDQFPGLSENLMATFARDELRTTPLRRTWPLLLLPAAFVVLLAVMAFLSLRP